MTPAQSVGRSPDRRSRPTSRRQTPADTKYSQSLERGLAILRCFGSEESLLGIAQLADAAGMRRSTTHRYVITLVALGYLEQDPSRKYKLGPGVTDLGTAAVRASGLATVARPFLEELRDESSYTAALAVLDGSDVCWLAATSGMPLQISPGIALLQAGSRMPCHATAEGKLLLAYEPRPAQDALLEQFKLTRHGPKTIMNRSALVTELTAIRAGGFALAEEEQAAGVLAIAAPLHGGSEGPTAAISITAAGCSMSGGEFVDKLGPVLIACAGRLSERLQPQNGAAGAQLRRKEPRLPAAAAAGRTT